VRRGEGLNLYAVTLEDDELFYCGHHRARSMCRFLNRWQPSNAELAAYLSWSSEEAREYIAEECRRITLRYPATCERCGQRIPVGARATWDPSTKAVLHGARCPLRVEDAA
jgi:hypothetical protein